jgi:hypothetical protein
MWKKAVTAFVLVLAAGSTAAREAGNDIANVIRDLSNLEGSLQNLAARHEAHIRESRDLRGFDEEQLRILIEKLCGLDRLREGDEAYGIAKRLEEDAKSRVQPRYRNLSGAAEQLLRDADYLYDQFEAVADKVDDLDDSPDSGVKAKAIALIPRVQKGLDLTKKMMAEVTADMNSLANVNTGTRLGMNDATVRAKVEYGKAMHIQLQQRWQCRERDHGEMTLSSGRPDCVLFIEDACQVVEFKPDTYSISDAASQAARYIPDVQNKFKGTPEAAKCSKDSSGMPVFRAVGNLYSACRP